MLSYNRRQFLSETILTLTGNARHPIELIVHDDGSTDPEVREMLRRFVDAGTISTLIENPPGHNQGVGTAMNRMFHMAQGDPIIKVDQDLIFQPGWLRRVVDVLRANQGMPGVATQPPLGALGLFRYWHDPVNHSSMYIRAHEGWEEVRDFVGSAIVVPRHVWEEHKPFEQHSDAFAEDVEFKTRLQAAGLRLGLLPDDLAVNQGFGLGPSTVAIPGDDGQPTSAPIKHGPHILEATRD